MSAPTASLEDVVAILLIDANEGRDVAIFDMPGLSLQDDMPK